jgi:hypothetical protein
MPLSASRVEVIKSFIKIDSILSRRNHPPEKGRDIPRLKKNKRKFY